MYLNCIMQHAQFFCCCCQIMRACRLAQETHGNCAVANNYIKMMSEHSIFSGRLLYTFDLWIVDFHVRPILPPVTASASTVPYGCGKHWGTAGVKAAGKCMWFCRSALVAHERKVVSILRLMVCYSGGVL